MIELKKVNKIYEGKEFKTQALKDVDFKLASTGLVSIVGVSGCGKTTMLNIIGGLDSKYDGEVYFDNTNIKKYNSQKLDEYRNNNVGFIFQEYNLINSINIYSNIEIALSLSKISQKKKKILVLDICEKLEIDDLLYKKPNELSGGQKQRVAIARALVKNPKVILADEPTGALDSKTSEEIMKIIKEISKTCLVVLVTHNDSLAIKYSDRIVKMLDGKIIDDSKLNLTEEKEINNHKNKKSAPFKQLLKLSIGNLRSKLLRTVLTIIACSIGIVSLCLVITVASGMKLYIADVQDQALKTYPITINSVVDNEEPEKEETEYEEYPDNDTIHITDQEPTYNGHINTFTNEFMEHIRTMDTDIYTGMSYSGWVKMRLLSKVTQGYYVISSYSYLKELNYEYKYMEYEYDVLEGKLPETKNDLVLVIDKNNCISRTILTSLGIETTDLTEMKFSDIIGKKYKIATNDLYYVKEGNRYVTYNNAGKSISDVYEKSTIELEIKGIVRQKPTAKTKLYGNCILYSPELTDYMLTYNNDCDIVKDQKENPEINVLTGEKFEVIENSSTTQTIEYQYEKNLTDFGANYSVTRITIYTDKFENFGLIHDYIEEYNIDKVSVSQIKYTDYLKNMVDEFEMFLDVLTKVLLVFATISLIVAAMMIIVITYVSVIEQTKQVGILRSIGFGKKHVTSLFIFENSIIGFCSGVLGIILGTILIKPVLSIIINVMREVNLTSFSVESLKMNGYNIFHLLLLLLGSVILTILSGIIPSILASKKDPVKALNQ